MTALCDASMPCTLLRVRCTDTGIQLLLLKQICSININLLPLLLLNISGVSMQVSKQRYDFFLLICIQVYIYMHIINEIIAYMLRFYRVVFFSFLLVFHISLDSSPLTFVHSHVYCVSFHTFFHTSVSHIPTLIHPGVCLLFTLSLFSFVELLPSNLEQLSSLPSEVQTVPGVDVHSFVTILPWMDIHLIAFSPLLFVYVTNHFECF